MTACETSSGGPNDGRVDLALIPTDIKVCFREVTGAPPKGVMTEKQVVALIGALRTSEVRKTYCGRRLLALYESQRLALARR